MCIRDRSTAEPLSAALHDQVVALGATVRHDDAGAWRTWARELGVEGGRLRLVGAPADEVVTATGGSPALAVYGGPVVTAGRVELLTFLREQAVSVTAHRFGTPHRYDIPTAVPAAR